MGDFHIQLASYRMRSNKSEAFVQQDQDTAILAKALGHPARISILKVLAERGSCVCGEVVDVLPLAQATVSQHLKELKDAGLIQGEIDGPRVCYCINPQGLDRARSLFTDLFGELAAARPNCDPSCC